jgi:hypothetical protein
MEVCLVERSIQHTQWGKILIGKNLIPCAANNTHTREKLLNRRKDTHKIDLDKSEGIVDDEQQQRRVDITTS